MILLTLLALAWVVWAAMLSFYSAMIIEDSTFGGDVVQPETENAFRLLRPMAGRAFARLTLIIVVPGVTIMLSILFFLYYSNYSFHQSFVENKRGEVKIE